MSVSVSGQTVAAKRTDSGEALHHDLRAWLDAAAELVRAVNRDLPAADLLNLIAGTVVQLTDYDFCSVLLPDTDGSRLLIRGSYGLSPAYVERVNTGRAPSLAPGTTAEGPSSRAFRSQRPVVLVDICADPTCLEWETDAAEQGYRAILALPLIGSDGVLGVLSCYAARPRDIPAEKVVLMETFANQAALAVEASERRERARGSIRRLEDRIAALEEEQRIAQRGEAVYRDLMRLLLVGETLERVAEHLARELRSDVLVEDAAGYPLATAARGPGPAPAPVRLDPRTAALLQQAGEESRAVELPAGEGDPVTLVAPVILGGEIAGRVWALNSPEPYGTLARHVLERGAGVVALAVSKLRTAQEVEWRLSREFLDDLLTAKPGSDSLTALMRARHFGVDLARPHTLLVLRADPGPDPGPGGPAAAVPDGAARLHRSVLTQVQQVVNASDAEALVTARGADVIVLWPQRDDLPVAAEIADRLRRHCRSHLRGSVSVGLGRACQDVTEYADAYRLAGSALELTQRAGHRDRVIALGDLGVYRMLLQVKQPEELIGFMRSTLAPLYDYDQRRDTTLVETLRTFLRYGCNATTTAEKLIVHPNTVTYRLRRIEELLRVDCHDSKVLLEFQFAFVIEDVLGGSPDQPRSGAGSRIGLAGLLQRDRA
jgi:sugar diacid utilization regulator/GAF domain-containing protein